MLFVIIAGTLPEFQKPIREVCNQVCINYRKSVTMSVIWWFSGLQIQTLTVWEFITVTDAHADTDFNVFEIDM